jgi:hypothetical protein
MPTIFLCHASRDKKFVRRLTRDLGKRGVKVWLDENDIHVGESIRSAIEHGLESAEYVGVVLSPSSIRRPWVNKEISAAIAIEAERNRDIILPILTGSVALPWLLADKKYADFTSNYARGLTSLMAAVFPASVGDAAQILTVDGRWLVDLRRLDGTLAVVHKDQLIRCTKGTINTYMERMSSTGHIKALRVAPGVIGRIVEEGGHSYIEHILPAQLSIGHQIWRETSATYVDTFSDAENYWEVRIDHIVRKFGLIVRFPKGRPPVEWEAYSKQGVDRSDRTSNIRRLRALGKPALKLSITSPPLGVTYVLRWKW